MDPYQNTTGPSIRQPRITPRNSDADDTVAAAAAKDTPWRTLNQLANIPRPTTPIRRASSAGPPSTRRSARRTPANQTRTPGARPGGSGKRAVVVTPHGRAAQRELDLRRAGLTPGKDRRRSGKQQRETPRDILRQLSRHLAPKTQPTVLTPHGPNATSTGLIVPGDDDLDDNEEIQRPRLSLPLSEDDDDDSLLLPPRSTGLEDENFTGHSIELARRAISEQPPGRMSRGSFGSVRMSDVFADMNDTGIGGDESTYLAGGNFGDDDMPDMTEDGVLQGENTETLQFNLPVTPGRASDIRPTTLQADDTETTFLLAVPARETSEDKPDDISDISNDNDASDDVDTIEAEDDILTLNGGLSTHDATVQEIDGSAAHKIRVTRKKKVKISKHGIQYPSLPTGVVKKLATRFARTSGNSKAKINKETLDAIMQASDWFFEQVSDDLGAYSKHAGRKTIDESDVVTLMARQRQINASITPFSLAQSYLPRELLQELRMVPLSKFKIGQRLATVVEEDED